MRVVIIDDSEDIARYLSVAVAQGGDEPVVVCEDFAQVLYPHYWDGVGGALVDLLLPGPISGAQILAWLIEHAPNVRRVVLSAYTDDEDIAEVRDLANDVLEKPAGVKRIRQALHGGSDDG